MIFSNSAKTSYRFGLLVCVLAVAPLATKAQQKILWEAAVTPSELNVYADASTTARVAMVLKQNYWVNVILELNSSGIDWCRIEMPGEAEPSGYVFCKELQHRGPAPKASIHSGPYEGSPRGNDVTAISSPPNSSEQAPIAGGAITDADILNMNKAGLPSSVLVAKIKSSACNFDTSPAQLQKLKAGGVPDDVILAMVEAPVGEPKPVTVAATPVVVANRAPIADPPAPSSPATAPDTSSADLTIPTNSTVFIEPMNGFETYLSAALAKKKVPLVVVTNKEKADFLITGASDTKKAGWAKIVFMGDLHSDEEASVAMVNNKTSTVVFAYAVNKKNTLHGQQTSAEACAKHLKGRIEGKE
jgi:hypothetical protein